MPIALPVQATKRKIDTKIFTARGFLERFFLKNSEL